MAERIKDDEDRRLAALFAAEHIADDGFSDRVTRELRRRIWLRRLILPLAAAIGGAVSLQPLGTLATMFVGLGRSLPFDVATGPASWIPPLPVIAPGAVLFAAMLLGLRMLED